MGKIKDLTGMKFGEILVLNVTDKRTKAKGVIWNCKCSCGKIIDVDGSSLSKGNTKTCGRCPVNNYFQRGEYMVGTTYNGIEFIFDVEDLPRILEHSWHHDGIGYIRTEINKKSIRLHRFIINVSSDEIVDHIDRNKLNNRKSNLRIVTRQQNLMNKSIRKDSSSKYKGVHYFKRAKLYTAKIAFNGKNYNLGYFTSDVEAAKAYNKKAKELFGEYAYLNKI